MNRNMYGRYETTVALPIEYGVVTAVDVISGLLFYDEHELLAPWQLGLVVGGCWLCLLGVAAGLLDESSAATAGKHTVDVPVAVQA